MRPRAPNDAARIQEFFTIKKKKESMEYCT